MARICPTCNGNLVNCPTCGLPPPRILPKEYSGISLRRFLYGAKVWEVQGIDISKWNGNMDFSIAKTKCQYVIMRAGYGNEWKDPKLDTYYRDAIANDMPVGLYWYARIGDNAELHADSFASEIATHSPQLDIVIDCEQSSLGPTDTLNWILAMDTRLRAKTGKIPMIYTSKGFWDGKVSRSTNWSYRKLWVANWTTREYPVVPLDWQYKTGDHWQWSADGNGKAHEYGSTNGDLDMDLDRYNGTISEFNIAYGTHIQPIGGSPVPPGVPEMVYVNTGEANLRHSPDPIAANICGSSKLNMKLYPEAIEKDQYGKDWYRLGKKIYIKVELTRLP